VQSATQAVERCAAHATSARSACSISSQCAACATERSCGGRGKRKKADEDLNSRIGWWRQERPNWRLTTQSSKPVSAMRRERSSTPQRQTGESRLIT
jgi:hypothetical protein